MQNFLLLLCHFAFLLLPFDFSLGFPLCSGRVHPRRHEQTNVVRPFRVVCKAKALHYEVLSECSAKVYPQ